MLNIEEYLVDRGIVSQDDLEKAHQVQQGTNDRLCLVLHRLGLLPGDELAKAVSQFYKLPLVKPGEWPAKPADSAKFPTTFLRNNRVFPIADDNDAIVVAMADPGDTFALNAIRLATDKKVITKVATIEDIDAVIERTAEPFDLRSDMTSARAEAVTEDVEQLKDLAFGTPVVQLVNHLLEDALRNRATDIHIEPFRESLVLRMRVDGMLRDIQSPPAHLARAIASRVKILAGLNIAERRLPQDGRTRIRIDGRQLDLRVATIPTIHGECIAIRMLDNVRRTLDLSKLGFAGNNQKLLSHHLTAPYGMLVVTGPTGSGKTTTLAAALSILNDSRRKILTIEDPIEYELEGVNQSQAKPEIGFTFAKAMRSFLRHDPDIIMVGEMRDAETAQIGVHAALTGHLVLTTLHTNTAAGAIPRLFDMGVDAYLLASSLNCVVAQRLVRVLCTKCRESYIGKPPLEARILKLAGMKPGAEIKLWRATGCDRCYGTGYRDRIAITEILDVNDAVRQMVKKGVSAQEIEKVAQRKGMTTLLVDAAKKCCEGLTTFDEVRRVTFDV